MEISMCGVGAEEAGKRSVWGRLLLDCIKHIDSLDTTQGADVTVNIHIP